MGVLLFELLAGCRPGRAGDADRPSAVFGRTRAARSAAGEKATTEVVAARRDSTPDRLRRRLRGDLDTIVARALAEEPGRRYPTAEQLVEDLERHLAGLPVSARGDSLAYRSAKFVRRHRLGVAAASIVLISLVGGLSGALWQAGQAARERDHAEQERVRAEQVASFVLGLFDAADPHSEERLDTLRARDLIDRGVDRVRRELAGQPRLQAQMLTTLGRVYTNLGLYPQASTLLDEALSASSAVADRLTERVQVVAALAELADRRADYAAADSLHAHVVSHYDENGWDPDVTYVNSLSRRAAAIDPLGRSEEAMALHQRALQLIATIEPEKGKVYAGVLNNLAVHHVNAGEHARAEPLFREVIGLERALYGDEHPHLAVDYNNLASSIHYQGRYEEAEAFYREALGLARRAYGPDHPTVAQLSENLATLLDDRGRQIEAEPYYREALRIVTAALGRENPRAALLRRNLGLNRHGVGEYGEAEALLRSSASTLESELGADHLYTALATASLARTLTAAGRPLEAVPLLRGSIEVMNAQLPEGHWRIHSATSELGAALAALGDLDSAEPLLRASYQALLEQKGVDDYSTRDAHENLKRVRGE